MLAYIEVFRCEAAHTSISHVVLTCPPLVLESRETLRIMAVTIVIIPTAKMPPMPIFSSSDILRYHKTRIGTAMTTRGGSAMPKGFSR